jgi:hypothetical protein
MRHALPLVLLVSASVMLAILSLAMALWPDGT